MGEMAIFIMIYFRIDFIMVSLIGGASCGEIV
jgi:hypothetical protein